MNFPSKIRIHVTDKDCRLGCQVVSEMSKNCPIARPVARKFKEVLSSNPNTTFWVGTTQFAIDYDTYDPRCLVTYRATNPARMRRFVNSNDRGYRQTPTSFTFVRVD